MDQHKFNPLCDCDFCIQRRDAWDIFQMQALRLEHLEEAGARIRDIIVMVRGIARVHGYAVGCHGSLLRDIDLIVAPWAQPLAPAETLARAIWNGLQEMGIGLPESVHTFVGPREGEKPHGRRCWSFHILPIPGGPSYLDLSFMPAVA